jgi:hypothetical protein
VKRVRGGSDRFGTFVNEGKLTADALRWRAPDHTLSVH